MIGFKKFSTSTRTRTWNEGLEIPSYIPLTIEAYFIDVANIEPSPEGNPKIPLVNMQVLALFLSISFEARTGLEPVTHNHSSG